MALILYHRVVNKTRNVVNKVVNIFYQPNHLTRLVLFQCLVGFILQKIIIKYTNRVNRLSLAHMKSYLEAIFLPTKRKNEA